MVVSLYVCDIPQDIEKEQLEGLFSALDGFVEVRIARDKNKQKIAFVDYSSEEQGKSAMNAVKGYRFHNSTKGITVRYSENTKNNNSAGQRPVQGGQAPAHFPPQPFDNYGAYPPQPDSFNRGVYPPANINPMPIARGPGQTYMPPEPFTNIAGPQGGYDAQPQQLFQQRVMIRQPPSFPQSQSSQFQSSGHSQFPPNQNPATNPHRDYQPDPYSHHTQPQQVPQGQADLLSLIGNFGGQSQSQFKPQGASGGIEGMGGNAPSLMNILQNLQQISGGQQPPSQQLMPEGGAPSLGGHQMSGRQSHVSSQKQPQSLQSSDLVSRIQSLFGQNIMPIPHNATNTVYVEGIPLDATEREVAHIFRPFPGFKSVRLIPREKRPGEKVIFCFADFDSKFQTTLVVNTLQGYRFDKDDILGLQFSYATTNNKYNVGTASTSSN